MGSFIFMVLGQIYGDGTTEEVSEFLSTIMNGLILIFQKDTVSSIIDITIGAAVALLICYFYMDLTAKESIDMITMDKLVVTCIKLVVGCAILIYLPTIMMYLFRFANATYETIRDADFKLQFGNSSGPLARGFYFGKDEWPKYEDVQSDFEEIFKSKLTALPVTLSYILKLLIPYVLLFVSKLGAFFIAVSNALSLVLYTVFSPIAVANCFDGGAKSEAMRYLKKFLAKGISFAVIVAALKASEIIGNALLYNSLHDMGITKLELTKEGLDAAMDMGLMVQLCVVRVSAVGAMFTGDRLAQSIVGSHDGH